MNLKEISEKIYSDDSDERLSFFTPPPKDFFRELNKVFPRYSVEASVLPLRHFSIVEARLLKILPGTVIGCSVELLKSTAKLCLSQVGSTPSIMRQNG